MARMENATNELSAAADKPAKRVYVKQTDVPSCSLDQALRIAQVIRDQYGRRPTAPIDVAAALGLQPQARSFRMMAGASVAYGFTDGGRTADLIALTELGMRAVAPTEEGDDLTARREGFMRPRVIREFLEKYDGSPLPNEQIGRNVLEGMGVDAKVTANVLSFIIEGAENLGLLRDIGGKRYVHLRGTRLHVVPSPAEGRDDATAAAPPAAPGATDADEDDKPPAAPPVPLPDSERNRKVFITHGSNRKIVEQLKSMLEYGEFEPVVSVERETTAKPVPKKVFDDMRTCGAGIIHVAKERTVIDAEGNEHHLLNENVLTEIGGAMALWGENFILLVEDGTKLPSNLQGLYEVRYQGEALDADATMRLLKAFKAFKS
jgi:hypothetical protein